MFEKRWVDISSKYGFESSAPAKKLEPLKSQAKPENTEKIAKSEKSKSQKKPKEKEKEKEKEIKKERAPKKKDDDKVKMLESRLLAMQQQIEALKNQQEEVL